jgi:hypothetical protein
MGARCNIQQVKFCNQAITRFEPQSGILSEMAMSQQLTEFTEQNG